MSANIKNVERYNFQSQDRVFLDTNIWLSVYGPIAKQDWQQPACSKIFKTLQLQNIKIFTNLFVISEFINRFSRNVYNQIPNTNPKDFKNFRNSSNFADVAQEISIYTRKIINQAVLVDTKASCVDIPLFLDDYSKGKSDFNDVIIANTCKENDFILITNDADFKEEAITILTANKRLYG